MSFLKSLTDIFRKKPDNLTSSNNDNSSIIQRIESLENDVKDLKSQIY